MARPKAEISPDELERLGRINVTMEEAALFCGVTERTLRNRLNSDEALRIAWEKGRATGRIGLRRKQMELALAGNPVMLIWLGKQLLAQREPERTEPDPDTTADTARRIKGALDQIERAVVE